MCHSLAVAQQDEQQCEALGPETSNDSSMMQNQNADMHDLAEASDGAQVAFAHPSTAVLLSDGTLYAPDQSGGAVDAEMHGADETGRQEAGRTEAS